MKTVSIYDLEYLTTSDIATAMRVSIQTVNKWVKNKEIKAFVKNGVVRVSQESFRSFVTENSK